MAEGQGKGVKKLQVELSRGLLPLIKELKNQQMQLQQKQMNFHKIDQNRTFNNILVFANKSLKFISEKRQEYLKRKMHSMTFYYFGLINLFYT